MKRFVILIWFLIAGFCVSVGVVVLDPNLMALPLLFGFSWGGVGLGLGYYFRYQHWRLNRKKNPLSWTFRIKRMKPYVVTNEGHRLTLTSRGIIAFLVISSWLFFYWICWMLKINSIASFEYAGILSTVVLFSLLTLYFIRRKRRQIVKFVPPPRLGKYYFITCAVIVTFVLSLSPLTWMLGIPAGLVLAGIVYLRSVRGRGWHYKKWNGTPNKFKWKSANYPSPSRMLGGGKISLDSINYKIEKLGQEYREHYNEQLRKEKEFRNEHKDWF